MRLGRPLGFLLILFIALGACQTQWPGDIVIGQYILTAAPTDDTCGLIPDASPLSFTARLSGQSDAGTAEGSALFTRILEQKPSATEYGVFIIDDAGLGFVVCGDVARTFDAGMAQVSEAVFGRVYSQEQTTALGSNCPATPALDGLAGGCDLLAAGMPLPGTVPVPPPGKLYPLMCGQIVDAIDCPDGGICPIACPDGATPRVTYNLIGEGTQPSQ